jgi:hypothetical protein
MLSLGVLTWPSDAGAGEAEGEIHNSMVAGDRIKGSRELSNVGTSPDDTAGGKVVPFRKGDGAF